MNIKRHTLLGLSGILLAGCAGPLAGPTVSWLKDSSAQLGDSALNVNVNYVANAFRRSSYKTQGKYHAQYLQADVQDLVIGLFDAVNPVGTGATALYFGTLFTSNGSAITSNGNATFGSPDSPTYFSVIAGTAGTRGLLANAASEVSGSNGSALLRSDLRTATRWMFLERNSAIGGSSGQLKTTTFGNIKPGNNRYYVFAAAFLKTGAATESDVAGFASSSVAVSVASGSANPVNLTLNLNFGLGSVAPNVTLNDATPSATPI